MSSKISDLTDGGAVQSTDQFVVARSGANYKIAGSQIGSGGSSVTQTSHGLSVGDVVRFNGTNYVKAQADSATNAEAIGVVSAVANANNFTFLTNGYITGLSGLTAGTVYFLSPTTSGALTSTEPSTVGQVSKPLMVATSTTSGVFSHAYRGAVVSVTLDPDDESLILGISEVNV